MEMKDIKKFDLLKDEFSENSTMQQKQYAFEVKPEPEIWESFRNGHEGAFTFLYNRYFDLLYNFGKKLNFKDGVLEDALQDFFIELRVSRKKLGKVEFVKSYLYKSFRRKLLRSKKKTPYLIPLYSENQEAFQVSINTELHFIGAQLNSVQAKFLERALNQLPKRQKEAIYHFYYESFSYSEIAEIMDIGSAKAARNLIYKGLNSLRKQNNPLPDWLLLLFICVIA